MQNTQTISIDFPKDVLLAINESELFLKREIKFLIAVKLYITEKITLGKAAQIADLSRQEFENELSKNQIQISLLDFNEIRKDSQKLN